MARPKHKGADLPDPDHVARHVSWTKLRRDGDDNVVGVNADAFRPRPEDQLKLSVNWVEHSAGSFQQQVETTVRAFRGQRKVSQKSAFAIGNVAELKRICRNQDRMVKIVWDPITGNPAHSLIHQLPPSGAEELLEALAAEGVKQLVQNTDVP